MEQNMNINDIANADNDRMISLSDISIPINPMPDFSDLYFRAIEDEYTLEDEYDTSDYFLGIQPSEQRERDNTIIKTNSNWWETSLHQLNGRGQQIDETGAIGRRNTTKLYDSVSLKSPTEVDAEELPSKPGGTTPLATNSVSKFRGGSDLRTTGNPYGYA
jgi:hypothetical protein